MTRCGICGERIKKAEPTVNDVECGVCHQWHYAEAVEMERRDDGLFLVGDWPQDMEANDSLMVDAEPEYVWLDAEVVRITLANGRALYGRTGERPHGVGLYSLLMSEKRAG